MAGTPSQPGKPQPGKAPPSAGGLPDSFWDSPMQPSGGAKTCPACQATMKAGSVICVQCGYDIEKGKPIKTRISSESASKSQKKK